MTDAALPLVLEPGTSAALTELQSTNGEIVQSLSTDDAFLSLLRCVRPPDGFATARYQGGRRGAVCEMEGG